MVLQDQALSIEELLVLQAVLDHAWVQGILANDRNLQFEIATVGAAATAGFASALRGEKLGHVRLHYTRTITLRGLEHPRKPHVLLSLQGRFKNVTGRKRHQIPLVTETKSGIKIHL